MISFEKYIPKPKIFYGYFDVMKSLNYIEDVEAFMEYCTDKKSSIEYETKPERLLTLSRMYKKLQEQSRLPHDTAISFTNQITYKVEQARTYIKNQIELGTPNPFSNLKADGNKFFTDKEINALSGIGGSNIIIELSEQHLLGESLIKLFMSKFIKKAKYEVLTDKQKRVTALIDRTE